MRYTPGTCHRRQIPDDPYDLAMLAVIAVLAGLVFWTFREYGVSNDEEVQHVYGGKLIGYYLSGFTDRSAFEYVNLYLYGGLFDMMAVMVEPLSPFHPYETRHLLSALIGLAGIVVCWRLARQLGGSRAGLLAGVLLAVTGPWYGAMFNHTKDIPFAVLMTWAVALICRIIREMPAPRIGTALWFGTAVGLTLGIRVGGLLLPAYAAVGLAVWFLSELRGHPGATTWAAIRPTVGGALRLLPALPVAYGLMALFWPWSVQDPLNPLRALAEFSDFHYDIRTMLEGGAYWMYEVPRWYLPEYLTIKLPLVLLAGALAGLVLGPRGAPVTPGANPVARQRTHGAEHIMVGFAMLFPVAWFVVTHAPAYTGIRHFLFVLPPMAVLAGVGLDRIVGAADKRRLRALGWSVPAGRLAGLALMILIAREGLILARLHPDEYVYFNETVGGIAGADRRYDTDYWVNTLPEAVRGLEAFVTAEERSTGRSRNYTVALCGERRAFDEVAPPNLVWQEDWDSADFFIAPTQMDCDTAEHGRTIVEVARMGAVLAVVQDLRQPPEHILIARAKRVSPQTPGSP